MTKSICFSLICLFTTGCTSELVGFEELNIKQESLPYELSVDGFISNELTRCQVVLTLPVSISEPLLRVPLNDATVFLMENDSSTYPFVLIDNEGTYASIDSIEGTPGSFYTLMVNYHNKTYFASDTLPEKTSGFDFPIESVKIFLDERVEVDLTEHNFGFSENVVWMFDDNSGSVVRDIYSFRHDLRIYTHKVSVPQGIFPTSVWGTVASGYLKDSIQLIKMDMSEAYYEYLFSVSNETHWKAGIFSTIPGNVQSNVSEGGTGFFYALNVTRKTTTFSDLVNP